MKLYLTVDRDRKAYNGVIYPKVYGGVEARNWNPDKRKGWVTGCVGCSVGADQNLPFQSFKDGNIFLEVEVKGTNKDIVRGNGKYRFREGRVVREWVIGPKTYAEIWQYLSGGNLVEAGKYWKGITRKMREEGWGRLENCALYWASIYWKGITKEMKEEGWKRLSGEWLYEAGMYWKGITREMREEGLRRLSGEWLHKANRDWNITKEDKK